MSVISKISQLEGKVVNIKYFPSSSTTLGMFQVPIFGLLPYAMKRQAQVRMTSLENQTKISSIEASTSQPRIQGQILKTTTLMVSITKQRGIQEDLMDVKIMSFIPTLQFVGQSENELVLTKLRDHTHLYGSSKLMKAKGSMENKSFLTRRLPRHLSFKILESSVDPDLLPPEDFLWTSMYEMTNGILSFPFTRWNPNQGSPPHRGQREEILSHFMIRGEKPETYAYGSKVGESAERNIKKIWSTKSR
ncbi:hypothetical protein GQ457_03G017130 [Hibiscus cannabinus]